MNALTEVALVWYEGRLQHWIRFGRIAAERILDRHRRVVCFAPNSVFAFVRWESNDYGTIVSRIDILRVAEPREPISSVPGVTPGGEILLRVSGWAKVQRVLQHIDAVDEVGIDPTNAAPEHWRHIHNRLSAGQEPRPYTLDRHQAWLLRRKVLA